MPLINVEYDNVVVSEEKIKSLSEAICEIVSRTTEIKDVFVYANSSQIKVQVAPIEIFVRMTAAKIKDEAVLMNKIKEELKDWKTKNNFEYPVNLTLIPMNWKVQIGI